MFARRRPLVIAGAAVLLAGAAALLVLALGHRERDTPVSVQRIVDRYRTTARTTTVTAAPSGRLPAPGTYVYATTGGEQATSVLGTRRHAYPARTTITILPTACGADARWDALETRTETLGECAASDGAVGLRRFDDVHSFFGRTDRRSYPCVAGSLASPARLAAGVRWTSRCTYEHTTRTDAGRVVGPRTLRVAGAAVRTVLVEVRNTQRGDTTGSTLTRTWHVPHTGLPVRREVRTVNATHTFAGDVPYRETVTLMLTSLRPQR